MHDHVLKLYEFHQSYHGKHDDEEKKKKYDLDIFSSKNLEIDVLITYI